MKYHNKISLIILVLVAPLINCGDKSGTNPENDKQNNNYAPVNKIALQLVRHGLDVDYGLGLIDPDGSNLTLIGKGDYIENIDWAPDAQSIIFDGKNGLCITNLKGEINLLGLKGFSPVFVENGEKIAFIQGPEPYSLFIANRDGSSIKKLADDIGSCWWNKERERLEFSRYHSDNHYTINLNGTGMVQIPTEICTINDALNSRLSPDFKKYLFWIENSDTLFDLRMVNRDGTNEKVILKGIYNKRGYATPRANWGPNSDKIVFWSFNKIETVNIDGSSRQKIIDWDHSWGEPVWSPI